MRKEVDWKWYHSVGLAVSFSSCDFQTNQCRPYPVKSLKLLSEPCFCYLKSIIVSNNGRLSEAYEKIRETCKPSCSFKQRYTLFASIWACVFNNLNEERYAWNLMLLSLPWDAEGVAELKPELGAGEAVDEEVNGGVEDSQVPRAHVSTPLAHISIIQWHTGTVTHRHSDIQA